MVFDNPDNLSQTLLFQRLESLLNETNLSQYKKQQIRKSITLVEEISTESVQLMRTVYKNFPEYTLHDETHLLAVVNLMGKIVKESETLENLSYIEITLLLLSAYLHDVGMAPDQKTLEDIINSAEFSLYKKNRLYDHEGYEEITTLLRNDDLSVDEKRRYENKEKEIEKSILTEYLRGMHGQTGFDFIIKKWSEDPRWVLEDYNISEIVAWICRGHTIDPHQIVYDLSDKFPFDKLIGQNKINIRYCTIILRLADILDFDRKRTPKILYENISPKNEISLQEWNKHIAVTGWSISKERIIFEAECTHPVYEKALRTFLDVIDQELQNCKNIVYNFPERDEIAKKYRLSLPNSVDRSKIVAKDDAYSYMDLSFTLSHEEIMKLLMGTDFWGGTSLCVRELIQNGYDAIRHRRALEKAKGINWVDGKITLIQRLNADGCLEFECNDNGMGMDRHILQKYFFTVGRSYYRSPEFENIRDGLRQQNVDFDPVSQFGIGIVSSFLVGNSLKIITQRYLGPNKGCGEKLQVEVDGFSRLVVIKDITDEDPRPGTRIIITGEKIPISEASDPWQDPLRLLESTQFYAAALGIPIEVIVEPPFNDCKELILPVPRPLKLKTELEIDNDIPPNYFTIIERDFSLMKENCEGMARIFFLIDPSGKICIRNDWGYLALDPQSKIDSDQRFYCMIRIGNIPKLYSNFRCRSVLSQDGVLVSLNDDIRRDNLRVRGTRYPSPHFQFFGSYFINLTGAAKLPLQANRAPYRIEMFPRKREEKIWSEFERELDKYISLSIVDIADNDQLNPDPAILWNIIDAYDFSLDGLDKNWVYHNMPIPLFSDGPSKKIEWRTFQNLSQNDIRYITINSNLPKNRQSKEIRLSGLNLTLCSDKKISYEVKKIVRATTVLTINNREAQYRLNPTSNNFSKLEDSQFIETRYSRMDMQVYSEKLQEYLSVNHPAESVNLFHPVIQYLLNTSSDRNKWFRWGIFFIANEITNDRNFDEKPPKMWDENTIRNVEIVVSHFKKVDWNEIPEYAKPPYKILYPNTGNVHEITLDYLIEKFSETGAPLEEEKPEKMDLS